jgi:hypothetical protein
MAIDSDHPTAAPPDRPPRPAPEEHPTSSQRERSRTEDERENPEHTGDPGHPDERRPISDI